MARQTLEERLWARADRQGPDECWEWQGSRTNGYGRISVQGRDVRVHRVAYELLVGPIPDSMQLDHLCRNRACVNPAHLEPVTPRENYLRGVGITAQNARKTHCINGHLLTPDNVYEPPHRPGGRYCRTCQRTYNLRCYHRRERERKAASLQESSDG